MTALQDDPSLEEAPPLDPQAVDRAIVTRRSVRAFLDRPVPRETVEDILRVAARAPSGTNMQPWKVYVATGERLARVCEAALGQHDALKFDQDYKYYPDDFFEPYRTRRKTVGVGLYSLLGIAKGDHPAMHRQHGRNFRFFDAPVGMIFTIDRRLEIGSWLDYGMFLQNVMVAARGRGLDTCPQAAFAGVHASLRPVLGIPDGEVVVCGMALGHADPAARENTLETDRAALDEFVVWPGSQETPA